MSMALPTSGDGGLPFVLLLEPGRTDAEKSVQLWRRRA